MKKTYKTADRLKGEVNEWYCDFMDNLPIDPSVMYGTSMFYGTARVI
jgi:hypothetical protein